MFLFLAEGALEQLDDLQADFERALMQMPPWMSSALARASGGWNLSWGELVCLEVLNFHAELWCLKNSLLVRQAWGLAQSLRGRTFAATSKSLLDQLCLPEVFMFDGWQEFLHSGKPILPTYKAFVRSVLDKRSRSAWFKQLRTSHATHLHLLAQHGPTSAGARLLAAGDLVLLQAADDWERLRLGLIQCVAIPSVSKCCKLCGMLNADLSHLLASCSFLSPARACFLSSCDAAWLRLLRDAPEAEWVTALCSADIDLPRLRTAVIYASHAVAALKKAS